MCRYRRHHSPRPSSGYSGALLLGAAIPRLAAVCASEGRRCPAGRRPALPLRVRAPVPVDPVDPAAGRPRRSSPLDAGVHSRSGSPRTARTARLSCTAVHGGRHRLDDAPDVPSHTRVFPLGHSLQPVSRPAKLHDVTVAYKLNRRWWDFGGPTIVNGNCCPGFVYPPKKNARGDSG